MHSGRVAFSGEEDGESIKETMSSKFVSEKTVVSLSKGSQQMSDGFKSLSAYVEAGVNESSEPVFVLQVKKKLKLAYNMQGQQLDKWAHILTNGDALYLKFFSHLSDKAEKSVQEALNDNPNDLTGQELHELKERQRRRIGRVVLPITLFLTELDKTNEEVGLSFLCTICTLVGAKYGPVHAAVKVGNVILEWNLSNLVYPHFDSPVDDVVLCADMRRGSGIFQKTAQVVDSNRPLSTQREIDYMCDSIEKQQAQLKELAMLIANYNRKYYYNPVSRNCQNFVADVLKVLAINQPFGQLEVQLEKIRQGTFVVPHSFKTHEDLDKYITTLEDGGLLQELTQDNIEVIMQLYLNLHDRRAGPRACQDHAATCKMQDVQRILDAKLENLETV